VKFLFPVHGDSAPGTGRGLAQGVGVRGCESLTLDLALSLEVPKPCFPRFEALHDGMSGGLEMLAGVLRWGAVTAADVPAFCAAAKMKPPSVGGQALHASSATGRNGRVNARNVFDHMSSPGDV
jgi:hypothetical protein